MMYRWHKNYASKIRILNVRCKYFAIYIFPSKFFLIKFQ